MPGEDMCHVPFDLEGGGYICPTACLAAVVAFLTRILAHAGIHSGYSRTVPNQPSSSFPLTPPLLLRRLFALTKLGARSGSTNRRRIEPIDEPIPAETKHDNTTHMIISVISGKTTSRPKTREETICRPVPSCTAPPERALMLVSLSSHASTRAVACGQLKLSSYGRYALCSEEVRTG
jgi:hypothetical protein